MRYVWTGLLAVALAFLWQTLLVHAEYHGKWNALFYTGALLKQPPFLAHEDIYTFPNSRGFDGQFYHYVAHDPFFQRGSAAFIDQPQLRYRRILVPLAAYVLALGRDEFVDGAYVAVILLFVFLGTCWLSAFFSLRDMQALWGLTFLLIPAVLISIDRMTVDVALIAFSVAVAYYFTRGAQLPLYAILAVAPLARETGLLLVAAQVGYLLLNRRWKLAALFSTAIVPVAAWYTFVALHTVQLHPLHWLSPLPFRPLVSRMLSPAAYVLPTPAAIAATALDYLALAGVISAIWIGYAAIRRVMAGPVEINLLLFALLATFLSAPGGWTDVYAFARWLAPLGLFAALDGIHRKKWFHTLPLLMITPRVLLQFAPHVLAIARYLAGNARLLGQLSGTEN